MEKRRRNDILLKSVGDRLRQIRLDRGLSQVKVYSHTEIHIARVENGRYNITLSTLYDLCEYYGITIEEFFKGIDGK